MGRLVRAVLLVSWCLLLPSPAAAQMPSGKEDYAPPSSASADSSSQVMVIGLFLALAVAGGLTFMLRASRTTSRGNAIPASLTTLPGDTVPAPRRTSPADSVRPSRPPDQPQTGSAARVDRTPNPTYPAVGHAAAPAAKAAKVFISYRRDDSADVAGRIYDKLVDRFGAEQIFKDVDSIPIGVDFRKHLQRHVAECDVLLAIIGDRWLGAGGATRRLDDEKDFVRIEIEEALRRDIPVVPVLVRGANMPAESDLPPTLASLAFRNAIAVRHDPDFRHDIERLMQGIERHG